MWKIKKQLTRVIKDYQQFYLTMINRIIGLKYNAKPRLLHVLFFILLAANAMAQPPNNNCATAQQLCMDESIRGTTIDATPDDTICFMSNASVWYTFSTNEIGGNASVVVDRDTLCSIPGTTGDGLQGVIIFSTIPCDIDNALEISNCAAGEFQLILTAPNLLPNTQYWVQIDGKKNDQGMPTACNFDIRVTGPGVSISAGPDRTIVAGQSTELEGTGATTYNWSPANTLTNQTTPNPTASPTETTVYTLTGTRDGCTATDHATVFIVDPIQAPNMITPNGDGINDTWEIGGIQRFPNVVVEIYSRWGQRVFISIGYAKDWDGTRDGKPLPVGTYFWVIQLNDPEILGEQKLTGYIAIVR